MGVFSYWLKIDDSIIGMLSSLSKILSSFIYAFALVPWVFYLGKQINKSIFQTIFK